MYRRKLEQESSFWVESGWLSAESREKILGHYSDSAPSLLIRSVALVGVLLLTVGVISFFAANWQAMPKMVRLLVLFSFLWSSYLGAGWCLGKGMLPKSGHALLLLGILAYGTGIMLVAQTYHINAHFPNGILLWMLGAVLTAWLMESEAAVVAAILLSLIWSATEIFEFDQLHWQWLMFALPAAIYFYRHNWLAAFNFLVVAFYGWLGMLLLQHNLLFLDDVAPLWLFMMMAVLLMLGGRVLQATLKSDRGFGRIIASWSVLAALMSGWLLSFPDLLGEIGGSTAFQSLNGLLLVAIGIAAWFDMRIVLKGGRAVQQVAVGILFMALFVLANLFHLSGFLAESLGDSFPLLFNILYFIALAWLIIAASSEGDISSLNLGFMFLGLWLIARYFDTFWELLDRSLFFLTGGALFLVISIILERKRRQLVSDLSTKDGGE